MDARKHMINEEPEEKTGGKSEFHEMYLKELGEKKYRAALAKRDGLYKYFFRKKEKSDKE